MAHLTFHAGGVHGSVPLATSPFRIGRAASSQLRLDDPSIRERHATLMEREHDWLLTADASATGHVLCNDVPVASSVSLSHGDVITFAPGIVAQFHTREEPLAPRIAPQVEPGPEPQLPTDVLIARDKARRARWRAAAWGGALVILLSSTALVVWTLARNAQEAARRAQAEKPLSEADATLFDALLRTAYDHVERGVVLLDAGVSDGALREFARAVNTLQTSRLRDNPWLKPRINALEAKLGDVYRSRKLAVPGAYAAARSRIALSLRSTVSPTDFASRITKMRTDFATRWGRPLVVTGADHPEHVSLYGPGGAVDLRVRDLSEEERAFVIASCRTLGLRVKDFSSDTVLQDQIRRAIAAGVPDRAGTGLHLHVDRFPDRRDAYTVD